MSDLAASNAFQKARNAPLRKKTQIVRRRTKVDMDNENFLKEMESIKKKKEEMKTRVTVEAGNFSLYPDFNGTRNAKSYKYSDWRRLGGKKLKEYVTASEHYLTRMKQHDALQNRIFEEMRTCDKMELPAQVAKRR